MFDEYIKANSRPVRSPAQPKRVLLWLGLWVASLFVVFALPVDLPLITPLAILLFPVMGLVLIMTFLIVLFRMGWNHNVAAAIVVVMVTCVGIFGNATRWGAQVHLLTNGPRYQRIVDRIKSTDDREERQRICGEDCFVVSSDPLRVSFHYSHFFLSWTDIVYDQTGTITDLDIDKRHSLNVYFISAQRLRGDWYLGHFGD